MLYYETSSIEIVIISIIPRFSKLFEETGDNLHIPLDPCTVYERARYLKMRIEIYLLCLRAFSREQRVAVSRISQLTVEERERRYPGPGNGAGLRLPWKFNLKTPGVREPLARGRVEGLKAARIGLTSCPECYGAYDGYTTVGFKLKRPWACRWHGSSRMFLSSDPKVRLIFFNWSLATETLAVAFDPYKLGMSTWKSDLV